MFESTENAALLEAAMLIRDKHPEQAIQSMKVRLECLLFCDIFCKYGQNFWKDSVIRY